MKQKIKNIVAFFKTHKVKILWGLFFLSIAVLLFLFIRNFSCLSVYFAQHHPYGELFRVFLAVVAGIGAIFIVYFTAKRVKVMEEQTKKTAEQIQIMYKGNVDTRFNNAVGHLGNEKSSVILGGIHALHEIAVENENYRKIVHNLFCSYIRENSAKLYEEIDFEKTPDQCPVIIQTLIDYLFKPYNGKDSVYKNYPSDLSHSTLKNCNFIGVTLNECYFTDATLTKCVFIKVTLDGCRFIGATLTKCRFYDAILTECYFDDDATLLTECEFGCVLTKCEFSCATLTKCVFIGNSSVKTTLTECWFFNATLTECEFSSVLLTNCWFNTAILTKCEFNEVILTECGFISKEPDIDMGYAKLFDCNFENIELIDTELPPNETS